MCVALSDPYAISHPSNHLRRMWLPPSFVLAFWDALLCMTFQNCFFLICYLRFILSQNCKSWRVLENRTGEYVRCRCIRLPSLEHESWITCLAETIPGDDQYTVAGVTGQGESFSELIIAGWILSGSSPPVTLKPLQIFGGWIEHSLLRREVLGPTVWTQGMIRVKIGLLSRTHSSLTPFRVVMKILFLLVSRFCSFYSGYHCMR
jgi:hypothetical protein